MTLLDVRDVTASYDQALVLKRVSLCVRPGELWAVLGPNGAGKSTLAKLCAGLVMAKSGVVTVCDRTLPQPPTWLAQQVAWVPQMTPDDVDFTGLEVALLGRAPFMGAWGLPSAADEALARSALAEVDATHLASRPIRALSGGEARRVWLARALVQQPKLLVLDEPTSFLDVKHQVDALRAVRRRVDAGLGVLAVLHDPNLAASVATHVLLLSQGEVLAHGPTADVLTAEALAALYGVPMSRQPLWAPTPPAAV